MADPDSLIEALRNVDRFGDVSYPRRETPTHHLMRHRITAEGLARVDHDEHRLYLTGLGRQRVHSQSEEKGKVLLLRDRKSVPRSSRER